MLLLFIVGMPVLVAMIQNYMDVKRVESRKARSRASCPPHNYTYMLNKDGEHLQCVECNFIPELFK